MVEARLTSALSVQLACWRESLSSGAERVGWKLGVGDREKIGGGPVIGHLTSATRLEPGAVYRAGSPVDLRADAEIALELALDVDPDAGPDAALAAIEGYGAALEIVDLGDAADDAESIVRANVFYRAFALGALDRTWPDGGVEGRLIIGGESRAADTATEEPAELVLAAAGRLGEMDERLQAGDRMIMGSIVQVPIRPGDGVVADLGPLGRVQLEVAP